MTHPTHRVLPAKPLLAGLTSALLACATLPPPDRSAPAPTLAIERLPNGATLVLTQTDTLAFYLVAAPELEPMGLEGLSAFLADYALEGAGDRQADRPAARALALGATLESRYDGAIVGWELALRDAPRDPQAAAALLLDVALAPHFPPTPLATEAEHRRELLTARIDLAVVAARRWAVALALDHGRPLGRAPSDLTLARVNRESLLRLHRRLLRPSRIVVVLPTATPEIRARLEALTEPEPSPVPACRAPSGTRFALAAPTSPETYRARRAPGPGAPGRADLEALFDRARILPTDARIEPELVDLGHESAVIYRLDADLDEVRALDAWQAALESSLTAHPSRLRVTPRQLARSVLFGAPSSRRVALSELEAGVTVDLGDEAPTARTLPLDQSRCRR
jgi:hypothetical protein